jgi:competence protein ComFC
MNLLDLFFPKYCVNCKKFGDFLCPDCFSRLSFDTKNICTLCTKHTYNGLTHPGCFRKYSLNGSFTCIVYNSISKKVIYQFKYKPHLTKLKKFLGELMYEALVQNEEFVNVTKRNKSKIIFVPIPLSKIKFNKRGYNQAEILAKELSKRFGIPMIDYLIRVKDTKSQVGLKKEERKENIKGAFKVKIINQKLDLKNLIVILVDDVLTTGSTLSEAGKVLKQNGAQEVWALALAKED